MTPALLLRTVAGWFAILVWAMANGALREAVLVPQLGYPGALIVSGLLLCLCVAVVAFAVVARSAGMTRRQASWVGALWLGLTLAFEFSFGALQGKSLAAMLAAYRFENGNLWPVVLLTVAAAPRLWLAVLPGRKNGAIKPAGS